MEIPIEIPCAVLSFNSQRSLDSPNDAFGEQTKRKRMPWICQLRDSLPPRIRRADMKLSAPGRPKKSDT